MSRAHVGACRDAGDAPRPCRRNSGRHRAEAGRNKTSHSLRTNEPPLPPSSFDAIGRVQLADRRNFTRVRQDRRLDQQTLSFITAARSAEAHDNGVSGAFRLRTARQQRIAGGQELKVTETDAVQTCRTGILHQQEVTGFAASVALPLPVQWLDHDQLRGAACLLRQALAFPLGKLLRHPMGAVQRFDLSGCRFC